jgi:hypothetical protein
MTKDELIRCTAWKDASDKYYGRLTFATSGERVEEYAAQKHRFHVRLSNHQKFWQCHIAPATNRPMDIYLAPGIDPVVSRLAERSYEIFCNLVDAVDELDTVKMGSLEPPRYRRCLNIWRYAGDAIQIFGDLQKLIEADGRHKRAGLAKKLNLNLTLFPDWHANWKEGRDRAAFYRNILAHHGRPWFFFESEDFEDMPYVLRPKYGMPQDMTHGTINRLNTIFKERRERFKFIELPAACQETVDLTVEWLNSAFERVVKTLEFLLNDPIYFRRYRKLWGWP